MYEGGPTSPRYISLREAQTGYWFEATRCNDLWCGGGLVPTGALVWEIATHWLIWTNCEVQGLEFRVSMLVNIVWNNKSLSSRMLVVWWALEFMPIQVQWDKVAGQVVVGLSEIVDYGAVLHWTFRSGQQEMKLPNC